MSTQRTGVAVVDALLRAVAAGDDVAVQDAATEVARHIGHLGGDLIGERAARERVEDRCLRELRVVYRLWLADFTDAWCLAHEDAHVEEVIGSWRDAVTMRNEARRLGFVLTGEQGPHLRIPIPVRASRSLVVAAVGEGGGHGSGEGSEAG